MSKKNIISTEKLPNGKVNVVFECADGLRTYQYSGSSARAFNKGREPSGLSGKLVEHKKNPE
jgi:hypothetical protein